MKFKLEYASDYYNKEKEEVEINTLDDLIALDKLANSKTKNYNYGGEHCSMIIDFKEHLITIYDDWIE